MVLSSATLQLPTRGGREGAADTPAVNDGKWHHFVAVTDASHAKWGTALYLDGVIHSINTNKAVLLAGTKNLFIGENPEALNRQWVGEIDDIGLWNRVLAPEEISVLFNNGQGMPVSDLPGVVTPIPAVRPYTIGLNFAADEVSGGAIRALWRQVMRPVRSRKPTGITSLVRMGPMSTTSWPIPTLKLRCLRP